MSITIIENHSEIGAGTRGSSLGVDAVKAEAWKQNSSIFSDNSVVRVRNQNAELWKRNEDPHAIRIASIVEVYKSVSDAVAQAMTVRESFPIILSGDHASAGGTIAGIKMANPNIKLGVVWIDAHADLHTPYTSPSGNVHGMPLAATLGEDNLEEKKNSPKESTVFHWQQLKQLGGVSPKIQPENLVFFGVRDTEEEEEALMQKHGITNVTVAEYRANPSNITEAILQDKFADCDAIYVSFDVDSLDCDKVSYGTGTPVPEGFEVSEVKKIISTLFKSNKVCAFEITEVNPLLDNKGNKMAEVAFDVLQDVVNQIKK